MIKELLDEKSSISSVRFVMFIGVIFSLILSCACLALKQDPNAWLPLISMFFLGSVGSKVCQKFAEDKGDK